MQTCRAFAPPARTVLYRRPVIRPSALADRFVERVLDDPAAAVAVHDISQIGYALLATPRLEAAEEVTETVLRTCPNISTALVRPTSVNEANRLGALLDALPRLSSLGIRLFLTNDRRANPAILDACLAPIRTRVTTNGTTPRLSRLVLDLGRPDNTPPPSLGLKIHQLTRQLVLDAYYLRHPRGPSILMDEDQTPEGFEDVLGCLEGNSLESFVLGSPHKEWACSLQDYSQRSEISFTHELFQRFPPVRSFRLRNASDMSIKYLNELADHSKQLEVLELPLVRWPIDRRTLEIDSTANSSSNGGSGAQLSPFESELVRALGRFPHLHTVDLGILPYRAKRGRSGEAHERAGLAAWARERGIRLRVAGCEETGDRRVSAMDDAALFFPGGEDWGIF
ncbi:hypothetical protein JCM8202_000596 [Rhodotorula sphaerocarpa]